MSDTEEEYVHTKDDGLPQEEDMGLQKCVTEDMTQKRKYICCTLLCAMLCVLLTFICRC